MVISRCGNLFFFWLLIAIIFIHDVRARPDRSSNPNCAKNGAYCQTHYECCSRKCMTYSYICAPVVHPNTVHNAPEYNYVPPNWWMAFTERPFKDELEIVTLPHNSYTGTHVVEKVDNPWMTIATEQTYPVENRTCEVVGKSCSDNKDCCSKRCHSYLRRCVT